MTAELPGDRPQVVGPSGVYGFREVEPMSWERRRVVQVVEATNGRQWIATPARYYAVDLLNVQSLAIDAGQGWHLPGDDIPALRDFAAAVVADDPCANCGRQLADHDRSELAACETEHHAHLLGDTNG